MSASQFRGFYASRLLHRAGFIAFCFEIALLSGRAASPPASDSPAILTNAVQVRQLSRAQLVDKPPVHLRAIATYVNSSLKAGIVQDASAGVIVTWTNTTPPFEAGLEVDLSGVATFARHESALALKETRILNPASPPKPLRPSSSDIFGGRSDCRWVEVEGIVRSASTNLDSLVLELNIDRRRLRVPISGISESNPDRWVESRVLVHGVVHGTFNAKDQMVGAELLGSHSNDVRVLEQPHTDPYSLPLTPIASLGRNFETVPSDRVHVRGIVTLFLPGNALFLQDHNEGILVRTVQKKGVLPGDVLDVIGFFERTDSALLLDDANFRIVGQATPVLPRKSSVAELASGKFNAELVSVQAQVLEWRHSRQTRTISLRANNVVFNARIDDGSTIQEWPPGSTVQVTGVCMAVFNQNRDASTFEIHLRSAADFALLSSPSWFAGAHIYWLAGGLLLTAILALAWTASLSRANRELERRVAQRTQAFEIENTERHRAEVALRESQSLYLSLVEHLPMAVYRKDVHGKYIFANSQFASLGGMTPIEVIGKCTQDILSPKKADAYGDEDEVVLETGQPLELNREVISPDGKTRHLHVIKTPVFNDAGQVVGIQGLMTDVTDRALAEAELASERDLLRSLLYTSSDNIYFKDLDSRFIKCSRRLAERFGLQNMEDVVGKTDFDFFEVAHAQAAFADEQEIIRSGNPIVGKVEKESLRSDGKITWALTSKLPLCNKAGAVIGTFGISKDITEIKDAEAKLEAVHHQLLETSRKAGMAEVATSVLHNVGNVLNSVTTSAGVITDHLRNSKIDGVARVHGLLAGQPDVPAFLGSDGRAAQLVDYLKTLKDHLEHEQGLLLKELQDLVRNIDHIKEIVSMQQSYARVAGVIEKLPPSSLFEDALRMHAGALTRHMVRTVRSYEEVPEIQADKHKVLQILINLISNAKYALSSAGNQDKVLTVRITRAPGDHIRFQVQDNGIGVAPENLTRIFSHGFTTRTEGHGFGLHAGALAASEMGGSLAVESDGPGLGATFTLELPCQPPKHAPNTVCEGTMRSTASPIELEPVIAPATPVVA